MGPAGGQERRGEGGGADARPDSPRRTLGAAPLGQEEKKPAIVFLFFGPPARQTESPFCSRFLPL